MNKDQQKVVQYLQEAHAAEQALVSVLRSQIAMTPSGPYRSAVESHLDETRRHAQRVADRLNAIDRGSNPLGAFVGVVETVAGQAVALSMAPLQLLRGSGGHEKILKNAKDACAAEALEIATYTALERLAEKVGDEQTAKLAASIRGDEERMLARVLREIPKLTDAVVRAEVNGESSYDVTTTGAADAAREVAEVATKAATRAKRTARQARKVPGVAQAEGQIKGAVASEEDLAIAGYDDLNAEDITAKLPALSQIDLAKIDAYERKNHNRATVLARVQSLRGAEPWAGYDELTVAEVVAALSADDERAAEVRAYERAHKNRAGVLNAAQRELSNA